MSDPAPRFLEVRAMSGAAVHRVDVTGHSDRQIERITSGMLRNMSPDYFVADTADDEPTPEAVETVRGVTRG